MVYLGTISQLIKAWEEEVRKLDVQLADDEIEILRSGFTPEFLEKKKSNYLFHINRLKTQFDIK